MGRLQEDSPSSYIPDPQTEQHQYDQPESHTTRDQEEDYSTVHDSHDQFNRENPQENYPQQNEPTNQQQFQPPPPSPSQPAPYPPQPNPSYPTQPAPYPPRNYPPPQAAGYNHQPIQPLQVQPTNYPPHATPQTYPNQAAQVRPTNYPPQASPQMYHTQPVQVQPTNYPPQAAYHLQPDSPYKPPGQVNGSAAPGFPIPQQYPPAAPVLGYGSNAGTLVGWTTGLFDCMDDPTNALFTAFFPCLTFGQVAEIVDNGRTTCATSGLIYGAIAFLIGVPCLLSCTYRTKLRNTYNLIESPAPDWVTHFFCEWCALCQEYRELRNRGLDPSIGWHGNAIKNQNMQQQQQVAMMPPINQTMMG